MLFHLYERRTAGYECTCPIGQELKCGRRFATRSLVIHHLKEVHRDRLTRTCRFRVGNNVICGKQFRFEFELNQHKRNCGHLTTGERNLGHSRALTCRGGVRQVNDQEVSVQDRSGSNKKGTRRSRRMGPRSAVKAYLLAGFIMHQFSHPTPAQMHFVKTSANVASVKQGNLANCPNAASGMKTIRT